MGAGSPWGSGFGSEGNASEFGSAYGFMQVMARARGLDNGVFKAWGSRGELPRAALAAPRAGEDTRGARLEAGASSRARPCQPPARARTRRGARLEAGASSRARPWQPPPARDRPGAAGASSRAGPCQPAARARTGRGARLEAGASSRARGRQRVRQRRQCQCIRQRVLVHAGHGMGAGLGQWTFQGGKTQLSRERDVHGAHVDACTVYLLRALIMAAIPP